MYKKITTMLTDAGDSFEQQFTIIATLLKYSVPKYQGFNNLPSLLSWQQCYSVKPFFPPRICAALLKSRITELGINISEDNAYSQL